MTLLDGQMKTLFPPVLQLNVGGCLFTTSLATVTRFTSMIGSMFSGRHEVLRDENGRYFIDRDGQLFEHILAFMRNETLPPDSLTQLVYDEACYLSFDELARRLARTRAISGQVIQNAFKSSMPNYQLNFEAILAIGKQRALDNGGARRSKVRVAVFKNVTDSDDSHHCDVDVTFGPWQGRPSVPDLLHCIKSDLIELEYHNVEYNCIGVCDGQYNRSGTHRTADDQNLYCRRSIYTLTIMWW